MAQQDGRVLVQLRLRQLLPEATAKQQPRRQRHDARELDLGSEAGEDGHGAALREAAEDYTVRGDAGVELGLDQGREVLG